MFISRYDGKVYKYIDPDHADYHLVLSEDIKNGREPGGSVIELQWHHCEWTNHPYYAASLLKVMRRWWNPDKQGPVKWIDRLTADEIVLVNLKDNNKLTLMELVDKTSPSVPNDFDFVWVWVAKPQGFIEDTTWLTNDIIPAAQPMLRRSDGRRNINVNRNVITADTDITKLKMYSVKGELVRSIQPSRKQVALTAKLFPHYGMYLVVLETAGGKPATFNWIVPR
ncbi:MAG: hypothetical protein GF398_03285 [Chitinivibrionales bacterium]|nr:hypothetical protein [Chitinivibrionales bacterium]